MEAIIQDHIDYAYNAVYSQIEAAVGSSEAAEIERLAEAALRLALRNAALTFLTFVGLALLAGWLYNRLMLWRAFWSIPGPYAWPVIGNALQLRRDLVEFFAWANNWATNCVQNGSAIGRLWVGMDPYVIVFRASAAEILLRSSKHTEKSFEYDLIADWLGRGLLTSFGKKWHKRRKLLTPAFHTKETLDAYLSVMNERCRQMTRILSSSQQRFARGKKFDMFPIVTLCSLDIICDTAMAQSIEAQRDGDSNYVRELYRASTMLWDRMEKPWLRYPYLFELSGNGRVFRRCLSYLHRFTENVIEERRQSINVRQPVATRKQYEEIAPVAEEHVADFSTSKKRRVNFLDLLLQAQEDNPDVVRTMADIREEVDTFMFEGHDTTSSAEAFAFWLLGRNPAALLRLQEEIDTIMLASGRTPDDDVSQEDMRNMPYLECVVKETLRLFPSVPFLGRRLDTEEVIDGHRIPAGTNVLIYVYILQRDPEFFERPTEFLPERFMPGSALYNAARHPYSYVPFSAGPRNCIGQRFAQLELKTMLVHVLRKYNVKAHQTFEELELGGALILRPRTGVWLTIEPRNV